MNDIQKKKDTEHDEKTKDQEHSKEERRQELETEEEERDEHHQECEELKRKIEDLDNQLKRAVADYINLQRRVDEEKREVIKYANQDLLMNLLPALNMLFLAGKHTEDQGVQLTIKGIIEVLKNVGVEKIETKGKAFDATNMEAVEVVDGEEGKVVEETRSGFLLNGKLLQPALVKVGGKQE